VPWSWASTSFDTADVYGWTVEHGTTEEIIGRWFAQGGGRRDAVILATRSTTR